ncbi:hypothetical protein [Paenibacillus qinlingensis]|uniref:Uncharacterized protein n=1 Tax=Paenibacillus qinlingensis TaxID=1837343 RepID=A0ABU1NRL3_9BACL|nr:hypothetical protein [Paenibacillus qinlingensis]MDR6550125.1 hypothetical protein [Paenibacillus qinlingensis]
MRVKKLIYMTALLMVTFVSIVVLWATGLMGLWTEGIAFIANNTTEFTSRNSQVIDGKYVLQVDLSDLESNIGKVIYKDNEHKIYVSWLQSRRVGEYDLGFRSIGTYSLSGASLISGIHHETINDHAFTYSMSAKMTVKYEDKTYHATESGQCGLNFKDGDCFSFNIYLSTEPKGEPIKDAGIVEVMITDLYKNIWLKK